MWILVNVWKREQDGTGVILPGLGEDRNISVEVGWDRSDALSSDDVTKDLGEV